MNTFWKSLAQVAQGQLFIGGHLSAAAVSQLTQRAPCTAGKHDDAPRKRLPWPRLAMPH
jgi:hypothetical protein